MKNIVGMISPETNCAPKLEVNRRSFLAAKTASTSACRPNTLTSDWPVKASSMWPFSSPVAFHWETNSFCDRLPMKLVTSDRDRDGHQRDQGQHRRDDEHHHVTPITVSTDVSSWLSVCCRDWAMLSMSLVTRLSSSPRVCRSK